MIPKVVSCYIQYRDAGNWKSGDTYYWINEEKYPEEFLEEILAGLGESVIPYYYSLPEIAPFNNEFIPSQGDDHSYVEADSWEFHEESPKPVGYNFYGDISEVIYILTHPEEVKRRIDKKKEEAKAILRGALKGL